MVTFLIWLIVVSVIVVLLLLFIGMIAWFLLPLMLVAAFIWIAVKELGPEKKVCNCRPRSPSRIDIKHDE